jgi:hypothetical protein
MTGLNPKAVLLNSHEGLRCADPQPMNSTIRDFCPYGNKIGLDTARLEPTITSRKHILHHALRLDVKCEHCRQSGAQIRSMRSLNVLADDNTPPSCAFPKCLDKRWQRAIYCASIY